MSTQTTLPDATTETLCRQCRRPRSESVELLSRHRTSEGVIVYARCLCGLRTAWLNPSAEGAARLVAQAARR